MRVSAGLPESGSVQEVLYFQTQTIRMMYKIIADAMNDMNITDEHPRDYLIFTTIGACVNMMMLWRTC